MSDQFLLSIWYLIIAFGLPFAMGVIGLHRFRVRSAQDESERRIAHEKWKIEQLRENWKIVQLSRFLHR